MTQENAIYQSGTAVTWDYHAGSQHKTKTGIVQAYLPANTDAHYIASLLNITLGRVSFGAQSSIDRYLIECVEDGKSSFYAPKATIVNLVGSAEDETEEQAEEVIGDYGTSFKECPKYILVAKSETIACYARRFNYGLKLVFTGAKTNEKLVEFTRPSTRYANGRVIFITGVAVKSGVCVKTTRPSEDQKDAYITLIQDFFAGFGLACSYDAISSLTDFSTPSPDDYPECVGLLVTKD